MKIISFSAIEILTSLLNKTKCQTIRPLWKKFADVGYIQIKNYAKYPKIPSELLPENNKTLRFKVGDKCQLMWKQRSNAKWFCSRCLKGFYNEKEVRQHVADSPIRHLLLRDKSILWFPKLLGTGTITEVFEIEMWKDEPNRLLVRKSGEPDWFQHINNTATQGFIIDLRHRDGFKTTEDFFRYFDSHYELTQPKIFEVRRWKWDENGK